MEDQDKHAIFSYHLTSIKKCSHFCKPWKFVLEGLLTNRIKENREYLTAILRALHYFSRQGGTDDDGNPTNEDVTNKENFKELFNIMCGSNYRLCKLFEKRKKNATLISKTIQNELLSCVQKFILECIIKEINEEETPYFGVIADEVTDCANWKQLGMVP